MTDDFVPTIDLAVVRRHLLLLRAAGLNWDEIAALSGVERRRVHSIAHHAVQPVAYDIGRRILAVSAPRRNDEWVDGAECRKPWVADLARLNGLRHSNELFIRSKDPLRSGRTDGLSTRLALSVCARCDVRSDCLTYALEGDERGIWGGTNRLQRDRIKQRQGKDTP